MRTNVKFELWKTTRNTALQIERSALVAGPYEATMQDVRGKDFPLLRSVNTTIETPVQFELLVDITQAYNPAYDTDGDSGTISFLDTLNTYLKDGVYVVISHTRHNKLHFWQEKTVAQRKENTWLIAYVQQQDFDGNFVSVLLKQANAVPT